MDGLRSDSTAATGGKPELWGRQVRLEPMKKGSRARADWRATPHHVVRHGLLSACGSALQFADGSPLRGGRLPDFLRCSIECDRRAFLIMPGERGGEGELDFPGQNLLYWWPRSER
ncbi:MAG: hypothetical protein HYU78_17740 [Rhodocyclales bacterium]|nr:hypothetical protein [Rhodocyclales bacterium]